MWPNFSLWKVTALEKVGAGAGLMRFPFTALPYFPFGVNILCQMMVLTAVCCQILGHAAISETMPITAIEQMIGVESKLSIFKQ